MRPEGIIPAVVTPFHENEEVNEEGLRELLRDLIGAGVDGVFTVGTGGEFWALTPEEKRRIYEITVEEAKGHCASYVGTCANTTSETIELTQAAKDVGADFVSILSPLFTRPTQQQLYEHYRAVAEAVDIPILLYSNPERTGSNIDTGTTVRLARDCKNIVGIKDSSGSLSQTLDYMEECPDDFSVVMGRDTMIYAAFVHGASAAIAATANVTPDLAVGIYKEFKAGNLDAARDKQRALHPVRKSFSIGTHPAAVKAATEMRGIPVGAPRAPVSRLNDAQMEELKELLKEVPLRPAG